MPVVSITCVQRVGGGGGGGGSAVGVCVWGGGEVAKAFSSLAMCW